MQLFILAAAFLVPDSPRALITATVGYQHLVDQPSEPGGVGEGGGRNSGVRAELSSGRQLRAQHRAVSPSGRGCDIELDGLNEQLDQRGGSGTEREHRWFGWTWADSELKQRNRPWRQMENGTTFAEA
jgi:hypothetical protein